MACRWHFKNPLTRNDIQNSALWKNCTTVHCGKITVHYSKIIIQEAQTVFWKLHFYDKHFCHIYKKINLILYILTLLKTLSFQCFSISVVVYVCDCSVPGWMWWLTIQCFIISLIRCRIRLSLISWWPAGVCQTVLQQWGAFCYHSVSHYTHTQPFNGLLSGTTQVGCYQKKHLPTHTHPD